MANLFNSKNSHGNNDSSNKARKASKNASSKNITHKDLSHNRATLDSDGAVLATITTPFAALAHGQISQVQQPITSAPSSQSNLHTRPNKLKRLMGLPAYYWVLIAQFFVILPHLSHLPIWLIGFAVVSIIAQLPKVKAKFSSVKRLKRSYQAAQLIGFFGGVAGLWLTYQTAFGLDVGVAFLLLCLIGKLWELYQRRDAYVVLNLSLFVLAALLLMDQGLATTLVALLGAAVVMFALIALNDTGNNSGEGRLRTLALLGISAAPLLVVLFLFFPRLPPLWQVQLSGNQATTGVSDSMSPGDFASLSQSTELAFRVEFANGRPPTQQLYWRGLVFSDFDGVTWSPNKSAQSIWQGGVPPVWLKQAWESVPDVQKKQPETYQVILQPTQQSWLFGLDYPFAQTAGIDLTSEFTLRRTDPVTQQLRYEVMRFNNMRIDTNLSPQDRKINLALPAKGNEKSRQLAKELFASSGSDPQQYIRAIQAWMNQAGFSYTLSPPPLPQNRIDTFLFETRAGFCEHYSSTFTFLMRAAGIPARVVAGYQGGELSQAGNVWEVRQMDAHAWSEVWLDGQGWVRIDPTSFVAPDRVEQGMNALTQNQGAAMFGTGAGAQISYQQFKMLQSLRRLSDQASYYWQKDVVGYDQDKQTNALFKWFNITSIMQQILWMAVLATTLIGIVALAIWLRRRRRWHHADLPLAQLSKRLARSEPQLAYQEDEGLLAWLERLQAHAQEAEIKTAIATIKHDYRKLRYGKLSTKSPKHAEYQAVLNELKRLAGKIK